MQTGRQSQSRVARMTHTLMTPTCYDKETFLLTSLLPALLASAAESSEIDPKQTLVPAARRHQIHGFAEPFPEGTLGGLNLTKGRTRPLNKPEQTPSSSQR